MEDLNATEQGVLRYFETQRQLLAAVEREELDVVVGTLRCVFEELRQRRQMCEELERLQRFEQEIENALWAIEDEGADPRVVLPSWASVSHTRVYGR